MIEVGDVVEYIGPMTGDGWAKGKFYTVNATVCVGSTQFIYPLEVIQGNDYEKNFRLISKGTVAGIPTFRPLNASMLPPTTISIPKGYEMAEGKPYAIKTKVCECGTDKHKFASHSTWCPKYERF